MSSDLLQVTNLYTGFRLRRNVGDVLRAKPFKRVHAVDGVSFTLNTGEVLALIGESGSGKTTTARSVLLMLKPDRGSIRFQGRELIGLKWSQLQPLRAHMQMIFQDPYESLDPRFRVGRVIEEPLVIHEIGRTKQERDARVRKGLSQVELTPPEAFLGRFPHELSGGQRQRVAIAASMVLGPKLLIADEPVSMLDVSVRAGVLNLIRNLCTAERMGVLMITHDLATAANFADRIAVMYLGRIVEEGPAPAVVRHPQHPYTRALLSVVPRKDPCQQTPFQILKGEPADVVDLPSGCRFRMRCPLAEHRCALEDPQLLPVRGSSAKGHRAACLLIP
jgi:oligopeptide/dipeptide ABC transporter ATP-binding protein